MAEKAKKKVKSRPETSGKVAPKKAKPVLKAKKEEKKKTVKAEKAKNASSKPKAKEVLDSVILRWSAPDYYTFERSPYWSLAVGVLAIVFSLILIYTNNFFPVIIIILAVIVTFQLAHDKPKPQEFAVDEGGILQRNQYISYLELRSFWLTKHETKPILYLEPINPFKAPIVVPLSRQVSSEVRILLLHHLPEKIEAGELLSDKLMRLFRL